jgi:GT2 family glycosyltransferase
LILNPDTYVRTNALKNLIGFMEKNPNVGAAGSKYLNPDNTLQRSCYPFPTLLRELWRLLHLDRFWLYGKYGQEQWDQEKSREVDVLQGACLILRHDALRRVGLFDEDYFMYTEEVDLCYRLKKAGWSLYWVPSAEIIHYGGQSTQQMASEMFLSLYQTKLLFFRKHYGRLKAFIYKLILMTISIFRLLLLPIALMSRPASRVENKRLARSYWQLLQKLPVM